MTPDSRGRIIGMLRSVLLGVLSVSSVVACKSSTDSAAKTQPGVAAGKVIEVKGTVTVKHGDASRPLAVGEAVEGDDTVSTGADGNVVIELAHNLVRWELGPNKTQKVNASIAWKAAKSTGPAADVEQDTAAAGRPAERSAVGTTVTEGEEGAPPAAEMAPAPAAPAAAPASDEEAAPAPAKRERSRTRVRRESAKSADAPAPAEEAPPPPPAEETVRTTRGATRGPTRGPTRGGGTASASADASASVGGGGAGVTPPAAPAPVMAKQAPAASTLVAQKQPALKACLGSHVEPVTLLVTVTGGAASVKLTSKASISAALDACVKKVIKTISFSGDARVSTVIKP